MYYTPWWPDRDGRHRWSLVRQRGQLPLIITREQIVELFTKLRDVLTGKI